MKYGITWKRADSFEKINDGKKNFPLKDIGYSSAEVLIDWDALSIRNNKHVLAASIFGDVSGFTRYIDQAKSDEAKQEALRAFHTIRREMATVIRNDFGGLRVQFQGDRVQGLFHLPKDDEAAIATQALEAAIGLQTSMEVTLRKCLSLDTNLRLAVGIDLGTMLVSKLGTHGHRDRICLGESVECAAECEERTNGGQIGITKRVYEVIPERLRKHFKFDSSARCHVATDLTFPKLDLIDLGSALGVNDSVYVGKTSSGITVANQKSLGTRLVSAPARWSSDE